MLLENEMLLEAAALINSKEAEISRLESDVKCASGCGICGYGSN